MKKKILFFYVELSPFIRKDLEMFKKRNDVEEQNFSFNIKFFQPFLLIRQFFFLIKKIFTADIIISRFVGYHTFLPVVFCKIFSKPSICIMGGTECISFPSIQVGNFSKPIYGLVTKWSLKMATHLCPVDKSLVITNYTYENKGYPKQGYQYFYPEIKTPYTVIPNGFDEKFWIRNADKKPQTFITVCANIEQEFVMELKGIDMVLKVSSYFPDCEFIIVGVPEGSSTIAEQANLTLIPPQPNEKLVDFYSKAEFYLQLSVTEGFPNALCEAMLCECIPVTSAVGGMPEIVKDCGFLLEKKNIDMLIDVIKTALKSDRKMLSEKARKKIEENYTLKMREERFINLFDELIKK